MKSSLALREKLKKIQNQQRKVATNDNAESKNSPSAAETTKPISEPKATNTTIDKPKLNDRYNERFAARGGPRGYSSDDRRDSYSQGRSRDFERRESDGSRDRYLKRDNYNQSHRESMSDAVPSNGTAFMQGDRRLKTVLVSQINTRANEFDISRYFNRVGKVREVKIVYDKSSNRSKGIAYVEFLHGDSIPKALEMDGSIFQHGPLTVEPVDEDGGKDEYVDVLGQAMVSQLHTSVNESDLQDLFGEFGPIKSVYMSKDQNGQSNGTAFITFENKQDAKKAINEMNNFEFMGMPMKVSSEKMEVQPNKAKPIRYSKKDASNRVMQMLASKISNGTESRCLTLSNMFNKDLPAQELSEISEDVKLELELSGKLLHYNLNLSDELVFAKFEVVSQAIDAYKKINGRFFDGKVVKVTYITESIYADKYPETAYS
eukprot:NODE_20_length_44879_cov_0.624654.p12 type:complete len:432 gc:universal NODE_20_length_44879_cov_0.624654:27487-26192(-)